MVMGKVESGGVMKGSSLLLMPNRVCSVAMVIHRLPACEVVCDFVLDHL